MKGKKLNVTDEARKLLAEARATGRDLAEHVFTVEATTPRSNSDLRDIARRRVFAEIVNPAITDKAQHSALIGLAQELLTTEACNAFNKRMDELDAHARTPGIA